MSRISTTYTIPLEQLLTRWNYWKAWWDKSGNLQQFKSQLLESLEKYQTIITHLPIVPTAKNTSVGSVTPYGCMLSYSSYCSTAPLEE